MPVGRSGEQARPPAPVVGLVHGRHPANQASHGIGGGGLVNALIVVVQLRFVLSEPDHGQRGTFRAEREGLGDIANYGMLGQGSRRPGSQSNLVPHGGQGKFDAGAGHQTVGPRSRGHHCQGSFHPALVSQHRPHPAAADFYAGTRGARNDFGPQFLRPGGERSGNQVGIGVPGIGFPGQAFPLKGLDHGSKFPDIGCGNQSHVNAKFLLHRDVEFQAGSVNVLNYYQVTGLDETAVTAYLFAKIRIDLEAVPCHGSGDRV